MKHFALIGNPLSHSLSKRLFDAQRFADADYRLHATATLDGLRQWVRREGIGGFNVTAPHKERIVPLLDALDATAEAVGAVNCVAVGADGRLTGHNTDAPAFGSTLASLAPLPARALVLGTGGAARAVACALRRAGVEPLAVSRTPEAKAGAIGYREALEWVERAEPLLLVNATPVGTHPDVDASPWPWPERLHAGCTVYDLVYNPSPSLLLRQAVARGARTHDGLAMLHRQAGLSWQLWGLQPRGTYCSA